MNIMVSSPILLITIFSIWLLISCSESKEYIVGVRDGKKSWRFPLPSFHAFTNWSSTHQFTIGDTIVFEYDKMKESVHEVNEHGYIKCNTRGHNHINYYHGGYNKVVLDKSGVRYFISGRKAHCKMGLKIKMGFEFGALTLSRSFTLYCISAVNF
ncbi:early nodulin protein [Trifolium repens]|nr:early nodulin protein [Trifolium repens]